LTPADPERGNRESFLFDLYTGMISAKTGARDQIRQPGRFGVPCFGLRRSDGVEVFDVYFAWKFRITDLPLFMISSFKR